MFQEGYLVLKENINKIATNDEVKGKFEPNWLGCFLMVEATGSGTYILSSMDGKEEKKSFNTINIKCFYA